LTLEIAKHKSV